MAEVVLGIGTSHGPQLNMAPDTWQLLYDKDTADPRIDYKALLAAAPPGLEKENTPEKWRERYEACHVALRSLKDTFDRAKPDVVVVIGDDQHEQFLDNNMPMFSVFYGDAMPMGRKELRPNAAEWQRAEHELAPKIAAEARNEVPLAHHLIDALRESDFDIAASNQITPSVGLGHAFTFFYRYFDTEAAIPMVPLAVNTFFPPNQPTPRRCYALGKALRDAVEGWKSDKRVAIVCSGGLSHTIIEEDLDQQTLNALIEKDADALCNLPRERLIRGTSEIRNWISLAGAMEKEEMTLVDYVPCYRSPASTGCAMAFATWD
jgi:hypothetical protein